MIRRSVSLAAALGGLLAVLHPGPAAGQTGTIQLKEQTYILATNERACAGVQCPEGHMCLQGQCMRPLTTSARRCGDVRCRGNEVCYFGTCFRAVPGHCEGVKCRSGEVCLSGACVTLEPDVSGNAEEAGAGDVVWRGRCLRAVDEATRCPFACPEGQLCLPGGCYAFSLGGDACEGVSCPDGRPCVGGECWEPNERESYTPCADCPPGSQCMRIGARAGYCVLSGK